MKSQAAIYQSVLSVVASSPGTNELVGPITAGTSITLTDSGSYDTANPNELKLKLNGVDLIYLVHWNTVSSTQISLTIDLDGTNADPDRLEFFIDRELS